ncbi:MAG: UDP-N-acetylmuramoyl-L-alanine--D-glutamate ligase [Chloroflexota bacterium]|nr:UDP-N-acetylmuramoyl-L-alanine--D-glutamate ligase [Chloroflexota bacterium]
MTTAPRIHSVADLAGRRAVVLGLARSGLAAARFLVGAGAVVSVYDRRPASELAEAVAALAGKRVHLALAVSPDDARQLLADAELVVTSPSVSPRFPTTDEWLRAALLSAEARGIEVVSEVELFLRLTRARVLAVTGTKGKTTTASILDAILNADRIAHLLGGNIGRPLIEEVEHLSAADWAVLELSELQLPTITRGAEVAVYTNIAADHLDRHGSVEAYRAVKARLAELSGDGAIVLNADDPGCLELAVQLSGASLHWYGLGGEHEATVADGWLLLAGERLLPVGQVALPGRHMLSNILAAALGASLVGASRNAIALAIGGFAGVPNRLERLGERDGVAWVNDSQATIPMAAIAALDAFEPARVVLIAGGQGKGLDYTAFTEAIVARCRAAVLIGETAGELEQLLAGRVPVQRAESMDAAVELAASAAQPGDVVLLSPAAASFDMFVDYVERGEAFRAAARKLGVQL